MAINPRDRTPQGDPETLVLLPTGALVGLYINGVQGQQVMLGIREDMAGQPVSCAITTELYTDTSRMQSNPRRTQRNER